MLDAKITLVMPRLPYVVLRCLLKKHIPVLDMALKN